MDEIHTEAEDTKMKVELPPAPYAGFWMRFWAYLLDLVIISSINGILVKPVFRAFDADLAGGGIFTPYHIASALIFYLYFVLMTKFFSQTLGKMVFGLKVIPLDAEKLHWSTVIFREWIGRYISATIWILYAVAAFTPKKQALHDMFADTAVVHERKAAAHQPAYS
ncbi:RDD family protein [Siminovitchia sediminis]|uniref:RDD family protein n=1 Tax=Siminovitchia sediminis TaxID=1274353 RepID=A0ABW4KKF1_9BACI